MAINVSDCEEGSREERVSAMKLRYANLIVKAQQTLSEVQTKRVRETVNREVISETRMGDQRSVRRRKADFSEFKWLQETSQSRRPDILRRRMEIEKKERESKKKEEDPKKDPAKVKRLREAARIAINNITKTVDFDNLSVMKEFEDLTGCPSTLCSISSPNCKPYLARFR